MTSSESAMECMECGEAMWIDGSGVAYHSGDTPDGIDHDADAGHVAVPDPRWSVTPMTSSDTYPTESE